MTVRAWGCYLARVRLAVSLTCALGTALALGCSKAEPERPPAGKAADTGTEADDQSRFDRQRRPEVIVEMLGLKPGMTVADIGAGTGLLTVHLVAAVAPGGQVVATDIDGSMLDHLRTRMNAAGYDRLVERRVVKPTDPGLEPARYDAILLARVDHYFGDRAGWLSRARLALVKGGKLAISNRVHHRAAAMRAAAAAGFELVSETGAIPGEFVAVFEVKP
ncbi:MAG: class I SAM-dependent methyltransferase [Myxococcaceae bacterium]